MNSGELVFVVKRDREDKNQIYRFLFIFQEKKKTTALIGYVLSWALNESAKWHEKMRETEKQNERERDEILKIKTVPAEGR